MEYIYDRVFGRVYSGVLDKIHDVFHLLEYTK